jgi:glycosyltransferase involved in cell wall biosynthesis
VYFGQVSVRKGVRYLLEAFSALPSGSARLTIIGAVEPALRDWPRRYPEVTWSGPLPQSALARRLQEQDVFVMPTVEDGFGQTVIQAMAAGVIPVATDRCGAAERVEPGKSGFRVPAADAQALADRLLDLAAAPERLAPLRAEAIRAAGQLTWGRYGEAVSRWVQRIAGQGKDERGYAILGA